MAFGVGGLLVLSAALVLGAELLLRRQLDTAHVQRRLEQAITAATDSLYHVRIGSARFSFLGRSFLLTDFSLLPDTAAFTRKGAVGLVPRTRYRVSAASLHFKGIAFWPIFGRQFMAATAALDSLNVEVRLDKTMPADPGSTTRMPQHYLLGVAQSVRIGRLELTRSTIVFSERKADGTRFGSFPFDSVEATISNLSNARHTGPVTRSCTIEARALLAGVGRIVAHFDYDLATPRLNLAYQGKLARMDGRAFNQMLVDVEGMRIRSGELDSASFQVDVKDDRAKGTLQLRYHDLELETVDKRTRERSVGDLVRSFMLNHMKLHDDNPSGEAPARTASLQLERAELPIFKFIWHTLRGGVFEIIGLSGVKQ